MIKEWMQQYSPANKEEAEAALREIMQEVALAGLQRTGFFEKAAFYGGTALRIFHGLDRFSEDLDFSLLEVNPRFSLEPYFTGAHAGVIDHLRPRQIDHLFCWRRFSVHVCSGGS